MHCFVPGGFDIYSVFIHIYLICLRLCQVCSGSVVQLHRIEPMVKFELFTRSPLLFLKVRHTLIYSQPLTYMSHVSPMSIFHSECFPVETESKTNQYWHMPMLWIWNNMLICCCKYHRWSLCHVIMCRHSTWTHWVPTTARSREYFFQQFVFFWKPASGWPALLHHFVAFKVAGRRARCFSNSFLAKGPGLDSPAFLTFPYVLGSGFLSMRRPELGEQCLNNVDL